MKDFSLAVIIPAYDCEKTIRRTVVSVLKQSCVPDEIIVVPNGSAQGNYDIGQALKKLCRFEKAEVPDLKNRYQVTCEAPYVVLKGSLGGVAILILCKRTGNKSDALNLAMLVTKCRYVLTVDADSILKKDCIENLLLKMKKDENVVAIGGSVIPRAKKWNLITAIQWIEYIRSFFFMRPIYALIDGTLLLSGTLTMFRRDVALASGGFTVDIVGEDMEIIVRLQFLIRKYRTPYKILYCENAICYTDVPADFLPLFRQRIRWHTGLMQSLVMHDRMLLNPMCGSCGMITYPYMLIIEGFKVILNVLLAVFFVPKVFEGSVKLIGIILPHIIYVELCEVPAWAGMLRYEKKIQNVPEISAIASFVFLEKAELLLIRRPLNICKAVAIVCYPKYRLQWLRSK